MSDHEGTIGGTLTDLPEAHSSFNSTTGLATMEDLPMRLIIPTSKFQQASTDHYLSRSGVRAATFKQRLGQKLGSVSGRNRGLTCGTTSPLVSRVRTCDTISPPSPKS